MSQDEPLIRALNAIIRVGVRVLAILMTLVIIWAVIDVGWVIYRQLQVPPRWLLDVSDILSIFSAFMAALIAIEIFANIVLYLRDEAIHVKLVLATALMASARKVIVFDYKELEPQFVWATAFVILALSLAYWFVVMHGTREHTTSSE